MEPELVKLPAAISVTDLDGELVEDVEFALIMEGCNKEKVCSMLAFPATEDGEIVSADSIATGATVEAVKEEIKRKVQPDG